MAAALKWRRISIYFVVRQQWVLHRIRWRKKGKIGDCRRWTQPLCARRALRILLTYCEPIWRIAAPCGLIMRWLLCAFGGARRDRLQILAPTFITHLMKCSDSLS